MRVIGAVGPRVHFLLKLTSYFNFELGNARLSGPVKAWFQLAYDVWILSHHQLLWPLIGRLNCGR
jgi:hypothetical protein